MIGNLHFKAAFTDEGVLVQDDLAVQQMDREHIHYHKVNQVFSLPSRVSIHTTTTIFIRIKGWREIEQ